MKRGFWTTDPLQLKQSINYDYFHGRGLLTCKRCVNAEQKQSRQRYQVLFTIGDKAFTRTYNSIRELKADTGRRPNQLEQSAGRLLLNALKQG
jgi:hypothetical protein